MTEPILYLSDSSDWEKVYQGSFAAIPIQGVRNQFIPIPTVNIPNTFDSYTLAVGASSFQTKPTWHLGFWLSMNVQLAGIGLAEAYKKSIPLGLSIVRLPPISSTYTLSASVPHWHKEMSIEIWKYVGIELDIRDEVAEIKSDLSRIETKIDSSSI